MTRVGERIALRHAMLVRALGLASLVVFTGCIDDRDVQMPEDVVQVKTEIFEVPQVSARPLDVLFVVDNSPAMAQYQDHVVENLPVLGDFVDRSGWDMHVGFVTADVGCAGRPDWRFDEQLTNGSFLISWRHLDNTRTKNYEGNLADHITRLATVGHEGCGTFRPFDAIVAALDSTRSAFHRAEADLAIFVIGAGDDQSARSIDEVAVVIQPSRVGAIPLFDRDHEWRRPPSLFTFVPTTAPRIRELAAKLNREGEPTHAITDEDYSRLGWVGSGTGWWGSHCFESEQLVDLDAAAGLQPNCSVRDVVRDDSRATIYERVLPACNGSNRPCWRAEANAQNCSLAPHTALEIDRIDFPPLGTIVVGDCEVAGNP